MWTCLDHLWQSFGQIWPILAELGPPTANFCRQIRPNFRRELGRRVLARLPPNVGQFRSMSCVFGPHEDEIGHLLPRLGSNLAIPVEFEPTLGNFGPNASAFDRTRPDLGQVWHGVGKFLQSRSMLGRICCSGFGQIWADVDRISGNGADSSKFSVDVGLNLASFCPTPADLDRTRPGFGQILPGFGRVVAISTGVGPRWVQCRGESGVQPDTIEKCSDAPDLSAA